MIQRTLACFLILTITWTGWAWAQGPSSSPEEAQQSRGRAALERLDVLIEILEEGRQSLDRSRFDLAVLLDQLDYEPAQIIQFVRKQIAFQQYPGLLRGARGTLMAGSGNALDQAVLLATLLKDSGLDARIARGRLSPTQASTLVAEMRRQEPDSFDFPASTRASLQEAIEESGGLEGIIEGTRSLPNSIAVNQQTRQLLDALSRNGISLGSSTALVELKNEAQDYFWVESREETSQPWMPIHPVLDRPLSDFGDLTAQERFENEIPTDLQHILKFQVFIETKRGDELTPHPIMDPWERPVANLLGEPVSYANFPSGLSQETMSLSWTEILEKTTLFVPTINGAPPPGARGFDRNGNLFDLEVRGMDRFGATALFQSIGGKAESAAGALSGLGSADGSAGDNELMALTSEWIEYSLISPGGAETKYRRVIFDRLDQEQRQRGGLGPLESDSLYRRLVFGHTFMPAGGEYPRSLLADQLTSSLIDQRSFLEKLYQAGETPSDDSEELVLPDNPPTHPHFFLFGLFDNQGPKSEDLLRYRHGPGLVAVQQGLGSEQDAYLLVDIIQSQHRAFQASETGWRPAPQAVVRQGVWETLTEVMPAGPDSPQQQVDKSQLTTPPPGNDPSVLAGGQAESDLIELPWSAAAKSYIQKQLRQGFIVIIPQESKTSSQAAWWRVDPLTGQSLGMILDGRGGALEMVLMLGVAAIALFLVLHGPGYIGCYQAGHRGRQLSCCYEERRNQYHLNITLFLKLDLAASMVGEMEQKRRVICGETGPPRPTR